MDNREIAEWLEKLNRAQLRDDVQEFQQVYNLGPEVLIGTVKVFYRSLVGDFGAEAQVRRKDKQRSKWIFVTAAGRAEVLERLASAVAAYLYPVDKPKRHNQAQQGGNDA